MHRRPFLVSKGRDVHLKALIPIHFFHYFGLTAPLPGVFDLAPAGFSEGYLTQMMWGDALAAILALVSFFLLQIRARFAIAAVWIFNVFGTLDYLNAAARVTPGIHDANTWDPLGGLY